ncbi:MAG: fructosamine kinase family protein [Firmicutes bacterium]|jgi:fructosamine-3-kinase|uniref:Fructosamine kinase n=1 Tax=Sulfobacillus benefaciens TaxID=453960 RepID=A0A2T2XBE2_9FIRM|nr:fructosamine kinase family protein [Bacillota bacterium]MCL5012451.1 fructosamine kinase family protein [Bacillota bacterium]PSR31831.1 MAG: hypothetical protein C7B43_01015 [Sulfobacillus benefaciens]HBQ94205.1 hypothetical protein [Sulfobacillus sp.]
MLPWQETVVKHFGQAVLIPIAGGSLAASYELRTNQGRYFLKYYDPATVYDSAITWRETSALQALKQSGWPVPDVILSHDSCIVLSWIEHGSPNRRNAAGEILGRILGKVHQHRADSYSLPWGNAIGVLQRPSEPYARGGDFYWLVRLLPLLEDLIPGFPFLREIIHWEQPIRNFLNHSIRHPTLVHGDLWSGNFLWRPDASPFVIDPAGYFGDPVSDVAFAELFGGFPQTFYDCYWASFGRDEYYECKKPLYQLYHALVHLKLFGQSYWGLTQSLAEQIRHSPCLKGAE